MLHPIFLVPLLVSAIVNRRWAIPIIAAGGAWLFSPDPDWLGWALYLSALAALTGLPLRWGIEELISELTPNRDDPT
jgi:hypothetical protein